MKYINFLYKLAKDYKYHYLITLIVMIFLGYTRTIIPKFLSYTIDFILLQKDTSFVPLFKTLVEKADSPINQVLILGVILVVFQIIRAIFLFIRTSLASHTAEKVIYGLRNDLFGHMQNLPYNFYKKNNTGDLLQRATTDVGVLRNFYASELIQLSWVLVIVSSTMYAMIFISKAYTLISFAITPFIFINSFYFSKLFQKSFNKIDHHEGEMTDIIKENITNVEVVKSFGSQKFEQKKYIKGSSPYYSELAYFFKVFSIEEMISEALKLLQVLIVIVSGIYLYQRGQVSVGTIVLFSSYTRLLANPIKVFGRLVSRFGRLQVAIDRVCQILLEEEEKNETLTPVINGDIEFQNVSFMFEDDNNHVLKDISFKIKKGRKVALIGRTGSGKSTIIDLLLRLYEPNTGKILNNGTNISLINKKYLRQNIGVIVQEPYIFSRNIADNIAITGDESSFDSIQNYATIASIHDDITSFKHGYDTEVGENGTTLSGGQKQRLAIARTLFENQNVIIFDDSLSAVDNETDRKIREAIKEKNDITIITITHKIQSILDYDDVIVIDKGKVIQIGEIKEVLKEEGYLKEMFNKQLGDEYEK